MQEEIFGPVLPLLTVNSKEEAASFINSKEPPLALYVFSGDEQVTESVISGTKAGGSCVNDCIFHLANPNLPFGGTGTSGYGHYVIQFFLSFLSFFLSFDSLTNPFFFYKAWYLWIQGIQSRSISSSSIYLARQQRPIHPL